MKMSDKVMAGANTYCGVLLLALFSGLAQAMMAPHMLYPGQTYGGLICIAMICLSVPIMALFLIAGGIAAMFGKGPFA